MVYEKWYDHKLSCKSAWKWGGEDPLGLQRPLTWQNPGILQARHCGVKQNPMKMLIDTRYPMPIWHHYKHRIN